MPVVFSDPFGHQSAEEYKTQREMENVAFYDMVKDLVVPHLKIYQPMIVQTQYHKSDFIWLPFSCNMRCNFYKCAMITPIVPMHWFKVSNAL